MNYQKWMKIVDSQMRFLASKDSQDFPDDIPYFDMWQGGTPPQQAAGMVLYNNLPG